MDGHFDTSHPTSTRMGTARQLAERDRIEHGLVCIFSILEPCRSFSFLFKKPLPDQRPFVKPARRKCLHLYFYFMDRNLGLIHVRIQTWFPMPIQIYMNGHEWLARKLEANGIRFTKHDNAFLWIEDMVRAQKFSDRFARSEERRVGKECRSRWSTYY